MKLSVFFIISFLLTCVYCTTPNDDIALKKQAFQWYSYIILLVQMIFAYYDRKLPIWVKVAWWTAFLAEDGGVLDSITSVKNAYTSCKANYKDPLDSDCATDAANAIKSVLRNVMTLTVGWNAPGAVSDIMFDGQHKRPLQQEDYGANVFSSSNQHSLLLMALLFIIPFLPGLLFSLTVIIREQLF